ncbi:MAG: AMP-binding protein [Treponema sp.]|nr:AMP-binding protein [Treponema sp.]
METINDLGEYTFPSLLKNSVKKFRDRPALSLIGKPPYTYQQVSDISVNIAKMLQALNLKEGSKIAILSTGRPHWGISYFSIVNYGMIAVPLLPDFSETEITSIIEHCEVSAVIVEKKLYSKIEQIPAEKLPIIIDIEELQVIRHPDESMVNKTVSAFIAEKTPEIKAREDDIASIIYTSGTTGRSKGVILTHRNLVWNAVQCQTVHRVNKLDRVLSFLPLSHVYEFTISFTLQLLNGASIYYLGKPPVVTALIPAFSTVQPTIVLSVPLVIEKIYKSKVLPTLTKNGIMKLLYAMHLTRKLLHRIAGNQLKKTFGGHIAFFGIGGAKVDPKVERFMKDAKFPYAIGYGLTETSPLLAGAGPKITIPGKIGPAMDGVDLCINNPDPKTGVGEVVAKSRGIMKGYYKDEELTKEVFTTEEDSVGEGYFKTGDLGLLVKRHNKIYLELKGRNKNMILGSSGENIYPEDIEFILNQHPLVSESLVVEDDNGLVALVQIDEEKLELEAKERVKKQGNTNILEAAMKIPGNVAEAVQKTVGGVMDSVAYEKEKLVNEIQFYVNSRVNKNSKVNKVQKIDGFEKTATQKIKRYLYDMKTKVSKGKKK